MPLSPHQTLAKALHLLDRGDSRRGEVLLREAASLADQRADGVTAVIAQCCLGELLIQQGRHSDAIDVLQSCLATPIPEDLDDVCAAERAAAQRILASLA